MREVGVVALLALAACDQTFGLSRVHLGVDAAVVERPDAAMGVCGKVGTECCAATVQCSDGSACFTAQGRSRCIAFGGGYAENANAACGVTPCLTPNPFTGDCSCPTGFTATVTASIDEGCGSAPPDNAIGVWKMCSVAKPPDAGDWAGAFLQGDLPECVRNVPSQSCEVANPITGDCTCPSDAETVKLRVFLPRDSSDNACVNGFLGGTFGVCLRNAVTTASLIGAFKISPDGVCVHSAGLAGCACPPLSTALPLRTIEEKTAAGFGYTTPTLCLAAP